MSATILKLGYMIPSICFKLYGRDMLENGSYQLNEFFCNENMNMISNPWIVYVYRATGQQRTMLSTGPLISMIL